MLRFFIVIIIIVVILFILRSRSNRVKILRKFNYKLLIILILAAGLLFLIATSGRYLLPQLLQLIKIGLPFITKFIGI